MKLNLKMLLILAAFLSMSFAIADDFSRATNSDSVFSGLNGGGNGGSNGASSAASASSQASSAASSSSNGSGGTGGTTGGNGSGCTRTQGFWGNSPAGEALLIELVGMSGMQLGNINYSAAQLDDILDQPVQGNALVNLAHQLIAAKLNVLNGTDDSQIADEIEDADDLIANRGIPPVGNVVVPSNTVLGQLMVDVAGELDDYNNGELNVPHCFSL